MDRDRASQSKTWVGARAVIPSDWIFLFFTSQLNVRSLERATLAALHNPLYLSQWGHRSLSTEVPAKTVGSLPQETGALCRRERGVCCHRKWGFPSPRTLQLCPSPSWPVQGSWSTGGPATSEIMYCLQKYRKL